MQPMTKETVLQMYETITPRGGGGGKVADLSLEMSRN